MNEKGFTKLSMLIIIILMITTVGLMVQNTLLRYEANQAKCWANTKAIQAAVSLAYAQKLAMSGVGQYSAELSGKLFAEGKVPECAYGEQYVYHSDKGLVDAHQHKPWWNRGGRARRSLD